MHRYELGVTRAASKAPRSTVDEAGRVVPGRAGWRPSVRAPG